jgi:tetratricopeptide (TPR) repeat protein
MTRFLKVGAIAGLAFVLAFSAGCDKLRARDQLNKGVQAYKAARFEEAIDHFQNAVNLDPNLGVARLYLATAYVGQYVPGLDTPENKRNADMAIEQYTKVLEANEAHGKAKDTTSITSLKGIASLYFNMKKFDEAKAYHKKVLVLDPEDPETYYSIGVIDWTVSFAPRMEARNKLQLKPEDPIKDAKVCEEIKAKNTDNVKEGIEMLQKAIELRPDYGDAMAYQNLMYREKADIECGDEAARAADLKQADDFVEQAKAAMKRKAEKEADQGGIHLDESK